MTNMPADVAEVFQSYQAAQRGTLLKLRQMILDTAERNNLGEIVETLKWGQPAYITRNRTGSTIRLGWSSKKPERASLFFICTTDLISRFRDLYADQFSFEGNREIYFETSAPLPRTPLGHILTMALTYHKKL